MSSENLNNVKEKIKVMIKDRLEIDASELDVTDDSPLFDEDAWGIDSVDVLDLVLGLEQEFGVTVKQDESVQKHFHSLNTLANYILELNNTATA